MRSILIIDGQAIVRRGIRQTLKEGIRDIAFGEARSAREAMIHMAKRAWDLIILDERLPDRDGISFLRQIVAKRPEAKVLLLSDRSGERHAAQARESGAFGYLSKHAPLDRILTVVRNVLAGNRDFGRLQSDRERPHARLGSALHFTLSPREREVLLSLAEGKRVTEVAEALSVSVKTVSTFKRRVLNKLGANSTADLVRYVIENDL